MERVLDLIVNLKGEAEAGLTKLGDLVGGLGPIAAAGGVALAAGLGAGLGKAFSLANEAEQGVRDLEATLGITREEAEQLGSVATEVFGQNWGTSLEEVNQAVGEVQRQFTGLGGIAEDETSKIVSGAFALRDSFGGETTEYISAARTLMEQFGISGQEATDFITKGLQRGLNASGDFLDTIGEYSTQLANGGASADQFFSLMETGLGSGVLGTDKAADAFKEFTLRIADGSSSTADALKGIGLNANQLNKELGSGAISKADIFQQVIEGLREMDDTVKRDQIGIALLGTQYEDLGLGAALNIDLTTTKMADLAGATDSLNAKYSDWSSLFGGTWRMIQTEVLLPVGDKLLDIANNALPLVRSGVAALGSGIESVSNIVTLLTTGDFSGGIFGLSEDHPAILALFRLREIAGAVSDFITSPFLPTVQGIADRFRAWYDEMGGTETVLNTISSTLSMVGGVIQSVTGFFQENTAAQALLVGGITALGTAYGIATAASIAHSVATNAVSIATKAYTAAQWLMNAALTANPIGIVVTALAGLAAALVYAYNNSETFREIVDRAWVGVKAAAQTAWSFLSGTVWPGMREFFASVGQAAMDLKARWDQAWSMIQAAVRTAMQVVKAIFTGDTQALIGIVTSIGPQLASAGRAVVEMLKQGISNAWAGLVGFFRGKLAELRAMLPFSEPKDPSSPLRGLVKTGATIVRMIQSGIDAEKLDLKPERVQVVDSFLGIIKGATDTIAAVLDKDLFGKLGSFKEISGSMLQPLMNSLSLIVIQFQEAVEDFEANAIGKAAILAEAIGKIVGVVSGAVQNLNQLDQVKDVPGPIMQRFINTLMRFVYQFDDATEELELEGMQRAAGLSEAIQKIVGVASGGVENLNKLHEVEDIPGTTIQRFLGVIMRLVYQMEEAAQGIAAEGLTAAVTLGQSIGEIVQPLKDAVQLFLDLQKLETIPGERLQALAAGVHQAIYWMIEISKGIEQEGLKAAAKSAADITAIFGAFKAGTDVIKGLDQIKDIPPSTFAAFNQQILAALGELVHLTELGGAMLWKAQQWRDQMKDTKSALEEGSRIRGDIDSANDAMGYGAGSLPTSQYQDIGAMAMAGGYNTPATPGWEWPELGGSSMGSRSAGHGSDSVVVNINSPVNVSGYSRQESEALLRKIVVEQLQQLGFSAAARAKLGG